MRLKKFTAAAVVMSVTVLGAAASAEQYTKDDTTGVVTWDFVTDSPETAVNIGSTGNSSTVTKYYTFTESGITANESAMDSKPTDKDMLIIESKSKNQSGATLSLTGGLYVAFAGNGNLYYTPSENGIPSVTGYVETSGEKWTLKTDGQTDAELAGTASETKTIKCTADKEVSITMTKVQSNPKGHITKIVFTPTAEAVYTFEKKASELNGKTLKVDYTENSEQKTVSKTLSADNFPTFTGDAEINLAVVITDVPKTVTITGMTIE